MLKQEQWIILSGVMGLTAAAWVYTIYLTQRMVQPMEMRGGMMSMPWVPADFAVSLLMWVVMMVAMMLPYATPTLLIFAAMNQELKQHQRPYIRTGVFLAGYLLVWAGFGLFATLTDWGVAALSIPSIPGFLGLSLTGTGLYQFTAFKKHCLIQCRTPQESFQNQWRTSEPAALWMGIQQGVCCIGCCWMLMALLVILGMSNLLWMASIAILILMERVIPHSQWVRQGSGVLLSLLGIWLTVS
ncbi:DUF2182 domain-containing protein [Anthocerotibacter panamensis]|uniref:DUF2182 domain-containing protein n=1 Tax=Anthocerotibacter panamensis TaxID=2857077 RepID=UPI001C406C60|nr:DUF2182 domain-containing protein [Anthocerotibacter panamensis]